ncbi:hypothetical protein CPC735_023500 [Coccidioides posadasii C735 delta SOWgp]|uniref:Uncharacterized protein n=1 Tax=Coccidioides posadasii (strain C735) TaxID=222929 RepID=C5P6G4_COCP7|nr:hypothetical protein CPC735_023500 [Coccidioides posadasii C735 delta SOWgp]EER27014.1 hypothetical protein CPC735_023500 [Coccidioides posadasii C735 delta SOWgp]|eukprot:XP_003069159.1 hypothetical protein CPC735_023500 [Coccidioides posadasii C735 delta SOWgp]
MAVPGWELNSQNQGVLLPHTLYGVHPKSLLNTRQRAEKIQHTPAAYAGEFQF